MRCLTARIIEGGSVPAIARSGICLVLLPFHNAVLAHKHARVVAYIP
jgi:hypothetical protein